MQARNVRRFMSLTLLLSVLGSAAFVSQTPAQAQPQRAAGSYVVQAASTESAAAAVVAAGGTVKQPLNIINAVSVELSTSALTKLGANLDVALYADAPVWKSDDDDNETKTKDLALYPSAASGTNTLHETTVNTPKSECKAVGNNDWRVIRHNDQEQRELQGRGVTVAVVDSGFMKFASASDWQRNASTGELFATNSGRCFVYRDFLPRNSTNANSGSAGNNSVDQSGHGTHVLATIADNRETKLAPNTNDTPVGVAPEVNVVIARALDANGAGTYSSVIASIDWILANKERYNIRVLNLSLYAPVSGPYWSDPMNQAVMKAWQSGIVVVAAAGNDGATAGTITVPGNVPYVITVGALKSGRYTTSTYDELAAYSSRGPTESAFVKPDVLVPASRTIAPMPTNSTLATTLRNMRTANPNSCKVNGVTVKSQDATTGATAAFCYQEDKQVDFKVGSPAKAHGYYQLSGTSMAAAEASGVVALILQANPNLTNNQVKYRLMATAKPAIDTTTGQAVYSPWEQGAGLIDANSAIYTSTLATANDGMNIALDLDTVSASQTHYWGNTIWNELTGQFSVIDPTTGQSIAVWNGTNRIWTGTNRIWTGTNRIWTGTNRIWTGTNRIWTGTSTWASSESLWAGTNRIWTGSTPNTSLNTAATGERLINE